METQTLPKHAAGDLQSRVCFFSLPPGRMGGGNGFQQVSRAIFARCGDKKLSAECAPCRCRSPSREETPTVCSTPLDWNGRKCFEERDDGEICLPPPANCRTNANRFISQTRQTHRLHSLDSCPGTINLGRGGELVTNTRCTAFPTHGKGATGKSPSPIAKLSHHAPVGYGPATAPHSGVGRSRCLVVVVNGNVASVSRETVPGVSRTTPDNAT